MVVGGAVAALASWERLLHVILDHVLPCHTIVSYPTPPLPTPSSSLPLPYPPLSSHATHASPHQADTSGPSIYYITLEMMDFECFNKGNESTTIDPIAYAAASMAERFFELSPLQLSFLFITFNLLVRFLALLFVYGINWLLWGGRLITCNVTA